MMIWLMMACDGGTTDTASPVNPNPSGLQCSDRIEPIVESHRIEWAGDAETGAFEGYDFSQPIEQLDRGVYRFRPCFGEGGGDCDTYTTVFVGSREDGTTISPWGDWAQWAGGDGSLMFDLIYVPDEYAHCADQHFQRFTATCPEAGDTGDATDSVFSVEQIPQADIWMAEEVAPWSEGDILTTPALTAEAYAAIGADGIFTDIDCAEHPDATLTITVLSADAIY